MKKLYEDFQVHDTLNPKLFDTESKKLLPEVRQKIVQIVANFEEYINVPIEILDIQLVGSNVSYNYTDTSDLDVHIIASFENLEADEEILQALYDVKKTNFNKETDIKIRGVDIEIYVQNVNSATISNGIYSVCNNEWVKEPKPIKSVTKHNTEAEVEKWGKKIKQVIESGDHDSIQNCINNLYLIRHNSLAVDGEYGKGNQIFKDIRSNGWLQALKEASLKSLSKKLSLESYRGYFINRYDK